MAQNKEYGIFPVTPEIELYGPLLHSELYFRKSKNRNSSFHKVLKRDSKRISIINIFGNEEFVEKRSEWLRKLNFRMFFVCQLHFQPEY